MIILFDLDGTLIDSTEAILESFHHACSELNFESPNDEKIKSLIGYPLDVMFREVGVKEQNVWDYVDAYKEHYRKISTQKTILLPFAKEAVVMASNFAALGIVTTKTGKYSKVLMEYFEIMHYFDVLIGREDVKKPKPDAEPILKALEYFNTKNEEIWMIGDTKLDLLCAENAGVQSIGVLSGYDNLDILQKYTSLIFKDSLDAIKYLKSKKKHIKSN